VLLFPRTYHIWTLLVDTFLAVYNLSWISYQNALISDTRPNLAGTQGPNGHATGCHYRPLTYPRGRRACHGLPVPNKLLISLVNSISLRELNISWHIIGPFWTSRRGLSDGIYHFWIFLCNLPKMQIPWSPNPLPSFPAYTAIVLNPVLLLFDLGKNTIII
jgi:hypothetical protein